MRIRQLSSCIDTAINIQPSLHQVSENLQRNLRQEQGLQLELSTTFFSQVRRGHNAAAAGHGQSLFTDSMLSIKTTRSKPAPAACHFFILYACRTFSDSCVVPGCRP